MKILIADSGSTKTSWALIESESLPTGTDAFSTETKALPTETGTLPAKRHQTIGLNPLYASAPQIIEACKEVLTAFDIDSPDELYFYGAGCSGERVDFVENALRIVLPTTKINVESDVLGACRALGTEICCIMGTGSIAALYDATTGEVGTVCSLGYILGDEGSGAYFGKILLSDYLKEQMPENIHDLFEEDYGKLSAEQAILKVYQGQFPNRYLATFASFIGRHLDQDYCKEIALNGIEAFFKRNIMRLQPEASDTISFVGSVAFHLQDLIRQVASSYNLRTGYFIKNPIDGLIEFHKLCVQY